MLDIMWQNMMGCWTCPLESSKVVEGETMINYCWMEVALDSSCIRGYYSRRCSSQREYSARRREQMEQSFCHMVIAYH